MCVRIWACVCCERECVSARLLHKWFIAIPATVSFRFRLQLVCVWVCICYTHTPTYTLFFTHMQQTKRRLAKTVSLLAIINNYNCFLFWLQLLDATHMRINKPYKYLSCVKNCSAEVTVNGSADNWICHTENTLSTNGSDNSKDSWSRCSQATRQPGRQVLTHDYTIHTCLG